MNAAGQPLPHESARGHVTGDALYTDDLIGRFSGLLHAWPVVLDGEQHPDAIRFEDKGERWFYALDCPICGDGYEREIKPRGRDPGFVKEFSALFDISG